MLQIANEIEKTKRLTKKEKRLLRKSGNPIEFGLRLKPLVPLTMNQRKTFEQYYRGQNLILHGVPGTGKTYLAVGLALDEVMNDSSTYKKVVIYRSLVETRKQGFQPGDAKKKASPYEPPYKGICSELFGRADAYDVLKNKGIIDFESTSFLRGITLRNTIVIVDEVQNLTSHELHSIITRVGKDSKILFCGDYRQIDLDRRHEKSGIIDFIKILKAMSKFSFIEFDAKDIVRSDLVKQYIITRLELEDKGVVEPLGT